MDRTERDLRILEYMRSRQADIVALIRRLVELESPTSSKAAVDRVGTAVADAAESVARVRRHPATDFGDHLRIAFDIPSHRDGQLLGLGHIDTVWEIGTLPTDALEAREGKVLGSWCVRHEGRGRVPSVRGLRTS